jgi:thiol:disulfide interchange protein DsbD
MQTLACADHQPVTPAFICAAKTPPGPAGPEDAGIQYPTSRAQVTAFAWFTCLCRRANRSQPAWLEVFCAALLALFMVPAQALGTDELLDPERAYGLTLTTPSADLIVAQWHIAEGYYLYRSRFQFTSLTPTISLGKPRFPAGTIKEDEFFGRQEIYRQQIAIALPVQRKPGAPDWLELKIAYQGCADIGFCFPPLTKTVSVALPPLQASGASPLPAPGGKASAPVAAQTNGGAASEQGLIAGMLVKERFWAMPAFFGFGLLLAFTPCIFPMIPILSSLIVGQGENITRYKAFILSLVYVLAMAVTYTVAGVLAAGLGQNIQVLFQNPWILGSFSAVFVLLSLSMFGFYDLQIPVSWQSKLTQVSNSRGGGTYVGVAVMGLLSALIVGPCVAAPLIGILMVIAATGNLVLGGTALFVMSLGMGLPLLLIGTAGGHLLPRSGRWMEATKAVFGVVLLGVAIWMLERIVPPAVTMLLWALLLIVSAVYMGALRSVDEKASGWQTLRKGLGVVLLTYGLLLLVGVAAGGHDVLQPLRGISLMASRGMPQGEKRITRPSSTFQPIKTRADLEQALTRANAENRPVMLDFYADWCVSCKEMEKYTFSDPGVQTTWANHNTVLLKADVTANDAADQALMRHFGIFGPPAYVFFGPDGKERQGYRVVGFMPADKFRQHLENALQP